MQWIGIENADSNVEDMYVLRNMDGDKEVDLAVVWGIENNSSWFWYIVNKKCSDAYKSAEEAKEAALAAYVVARMERTS